MTEVSHASERAVAVLPLELRVDCCANCPDPSSRLSTHRLLYLKLAGDTVIIKAISSRPDE